MYIYKNKLFNKWAIKEKISDNVLIKAVNEINEGLVDANLGGNVIKKRIAVGSRGKSGGVRTIVAYQVGEVAFFIYGFAKNARVNINDQELRSLKLYAKELFSYNSKEIAKAKQDGNLIEVKNNG